MIIFVKALAQVFQKTLLLFCRGFLMDLGQGNFLVSLGLDHFFLWVGRRTGRTGENGGERRKEKGGVEKKRSQKSPKRCWFNSRILIILLLPWILCLCGSVVHLCGFQRAPRGFVSFTPAMADNLEGIPFRPRSLKQFKRHVKKLNDKSQFEEEFMVPFFPSCFFPLFFHSESADN